MRRVLVVDGFDESREDVVRAIEKAGYAAEGVAEEDEAVAAIAGAAIDVIVLDLPIEETIEAAVAIGQA